MEKPIEVTEGVDYLGQIQLSGKRLGAIAAELRDASAGYLNLQNEIEGEHPSLTDLRKWKVEIDQLKLRMDSQSLNMENAIIAHSLLRTLGNNPDRAMANLRSQLRYKLPRHVQTAMEAPGFSDEDPPMEYIAYIAQMKGKQLRGEELEATDNHNDLEQSFVQALRWLALALEGNQNPIGSYAKGKLQWNESLILVANLWRGTSQTVIGELIDVTQASISRTISRCFAVLREAAALCRVLPPLNELGLTLVTVPSWQPSDSSMDFFLEDGVGRPVFSLKFNHMRHTFPLFAEDGGEVNGRYARLNPLDPTKDKIFEIPLDEDEISDYDTQDVMRSDLGDLLDQFYHHGGISALPASTGSRERLPAHRQPKRDQPVRLEFLWLALWPGGEVSLHPPIVSHVDIDDDGVARFFGYGVPEFMGSFDGMSLKDAVHGIWW